MLKRIVIFLAFISCSPLCAMFTQFLPKPNDQKILSRNFKMTAGNYAFLSRSPETPGQDFNNDKDCQDLLAAAKDNKWLQVLAILQRKPSLINANAKSGKAKKERGVLHIFMEKREKLQLQDSADVFAKLLAIFPKNDDPSWIKALIKDDTTLEKIYEACFCPQKSDNTNSQTATLATPSRNTPGAANDSLSDDSVSASPISFTPVPSSSSATRAGVAMFEDSTANAVATAQAPGISEVEHQNQQTTGEAPEAGTVSAPASIDNLNLNSSAIPVSLSIPQQHTVNVQASDQRPLHDFSIDSFTSSPVPAAAVTVPVGTVGAQPASQKPLHEFSIDGVASSSVPGVSATTPNTVNTQASVQQPSGFSGSALANLESIQLISQQTSAAPVMHNGNTDGNNSSTAAEATPDQTAKKEQTKPIFSPILGLDEFSIAASPAHAPATPQSATLQTPVITITPVLNDTTSSDSSFSSVPAAAAVNPLGTPAPAVQTETPPPGPILKSVAKQWTRPGPSRLAIAHPAATMDSINDSEKDHTPQNSADPTKDVESSREDSDVTNSGFGQAHTRPSPTVANQESSLAKIREFAEQHNYAEIHSHLNQLPEEVRDRLLFCNIVPAKTLLHLFIEDENNGPKDAIYFKEWFSLICRPSDKDFIDELLHLAANVRRQALLDIMNEIIQTKIQKEQPGRQSETNQNELERQETERRAQEEIARGAAADAKAQEDAEAKTKEETNRKSAGDAKAKEDGETKTKEEADRKAAAAAKAKEDADAKAKDEADKKAAELKAQQDAASSKSDKSFITMPRAILGMTGLLALLGGYPIKKYYDRWQTNKVRRSKPTEDKPLEPARAQ